MHRRYTVYSVSKRKVLHICNTLSRSICVSYWYYYLFCHCCTIATLPRGLSPKIASDRWRASESLCLPPNLRASPLKPLNPLTAFEPHWSHWRRWRALKPLNPLIRSVLPAVRLDSMDSLRSVPISPTDRTAVFCVLGNQSVAIEYNLWGSPFCNCIYIILSLWPTVNQKMASFIDHYI